MTPVCVCCVLSPRAASPWRSAPRGSPPGASGRVSGVRRTYLLRPTRRGSDAPRLAVQPHLSPVLPGSLDGTGRNPAARSPGPCRISDPCGQRVQLPALDDLVDDAVGLGLVGGEDLVALDVGADLLDRLAGVAGQDLLHLAAHPLDLRGVDLQVGHLTAGLARGLVDEHPGVRQRQALARRAGREQDGGGGGGLAHADGLDVRADEHHRVVDRHERGERAAGRVDVDRDVAIGVGRLQRDQLGHDVVGRGVVDLHPEEDDPLLEELVVRVGLLHAVARALHEGGQDVAAGGHLEGHGGVLRAQLSVTGLLLSVMAALLTTWSTKPYSRASAAVNQRSRSESFSICSIDWPVWKDCSSLSSRFVRRNRSAWIAMSDAVPPTPAEGWCIMIRACGRAYRLPLVPAVSRNWPIEAARPMP